MIKQVFIVLVACLSIINSTTLCAQESKSDKENSKINRSIYLEFLGPSNFLGLSYDSRIRPESSWGYRIGVGYYYEKSSLFTSQYSNFGLSAPIEVNYLLGKRRHKLEVGLGVNLGIYSDKTFYYINSVDSQDLNMQQTTGYTRQTKFGYYFYSNIGYRYQAKKGFLFRTGISPSFNFGDKYGVRKRPILYPYIAVGYSF